MKWVCWTWQPWARPGNSLPFSCEIADISGYFVAKLLVPDEICLSDGSSFLLALSKLTSQPQGEITASTETPSLWDIECMSIATGKNGEKEKKREGEKDLTIFYLGKKAILTPSMALVSLCCKGVVSPCSGQIPSQLTPKISWLHVCCSGQSSDGQREPQQSTSSVTQQHYWFNWFVYAYV